MKSPRTIRRQTYKTELSELLSRTKESHKVSKRYKVLRWVLESEWHNLLSHFSPDTMEVFLQDVLYVDRLLRKETEDDDVEEKKILAQEKQIEIGYGPMYNQDIKVLKNLKN